MDKNSLINAMEAVWFAVVAVLFFVGYLLVTPNQASAECDRESAALEMEATAE